MEWPIVIIPSGAESRSALRRVNLTEFIPESWHLSRLFPLWVRDDGEVLAGHLCPSEFEERPRPIFSLNGRQCLLISHLPVLGCLLKVSQKLLALLPLFFTLDNDTGWRYAFLIML